MDPDAGKWVTVAEAARRLKIHARQGRHSGVSLACRPEFNQ